MADEAVRVNLILKGELARAFEAEYRAEVTRSLEAGERRPPSMAEVARAIVQEGLRVRGHTQVEDGTTDWGGVRDRSELASDEEGQELAYATSMA